MTVADAIKHPTAKIILLAEISAAKWLRTWTRAPGTTYVWQCPLDKRPTAVNVGSVMAFETNSVISCDQTLNQYFWDGATLYLSPVDGDFVYSDPFTQPVLVTLSFFLSNTARVYNDTFYDPRLQNVPGIQMRIERNFGGVGQIGGGTMEFVNDGFFDEFKDLQWDNGRVVLKLGVDLPPDKEMPYGNFEPLGTWGVDEWVIDSSKFSLKLVESKSKLNLKIPIDSYARESFPNITDQGVGKPIQIAYGVVLGATPVVIDKAGKKFKVAGHKVFSFDAVRIRSASTENAAWATSAFVTKDLANGEFTLGGDWTGEQDVSVDFTGKSDAGGLLIANAIDIVQDVLALVGETNINAASFVTARNRLVAGTDIGGGEVTLRAPSVYLDKQQTALQTVSDILAAVGAYLYTDATGQYFIGVFEPETGEGLPQFSDIDVLSYKEENFIVDQQQTITRSTVEYARRDADEFSQFYTFEDARLQSVHAQSVPVLKTAMLPFVAVSDAQYSAQRDLVMFGMPRKVLTIEIPWQAFLLKPGNQILLKYDRKRINAVFEVLEVKLNLNAKNVTLTLGNLRGWNDATGFWVDDAAALPARFAGFAGYGTGSLTWNKDWHPEVKAWARQNVGYWTDENGFADPHDPDSLIPSAWF